MRFSKPFAAFGIEQNKQRLAEGTRSGQGRELKGFVQFQTRAKEQILVKVGISGTGIEGARKNLAAEIPMELQPGAGGGRPAMAGHAGLVRVETSIQDPDTFYAKLYLSCLAPIFSTMWTATYRGWTAKPPQPRFPELHDFFTVGHLPAEHPP
jgi:putative alpha-1,2-mannosidase